MYSYLFELCCLICTKINVLDINSCNTEKVDAEILVKKIFKLSNFTSALFPGKKPKLLFLFLRFRKILYNVGNSAEFSEVKQEHINVRCFC